MRDRVAELASLMDRAGHLGRDVAGDTAREGELAEERAHALFVARDMRIELRVGALEVGVGNETRPAVAGSGDVDRVQVTLPDGTVHVHIDEVEARRGAEVPEQARLDVLCHEGLFQERVGEQVDLPDREVVGRAPVGVDQSQFVCRERSFDCGLGGLGFRVRRHSPTSRVDPVAVNGSLPWFCLLRHHPARSAAGPFHSGQRGNRRSEAVRQRGVSGQLPRVRPIILR